MTVVGKRRREGPGYCYALHFERAECTKEDEVERIEAYDMSYDKTRDCVLTGWKGAVMWDLVVAGLQRDIVFSTMHVAYDRTLKVSVFVVSCHIYAYMYLHSGLFN